jgi:hypothetical protein
MQIVVSEGARRLILDRGGELFLWQKPFGGEYAFDRVGFRRPSSPAFERVVRSDGMEVWVADDLPFPAELQIDVGRMRRRRLRIRWDGRLWGWRGSVLGTAA